MQNELFEQWKPIKEYEGLYEISNFGRVKSLPRNGTIKNEKILSNEIKKNGYVQISLHKNHKQKSFLLHCLVWDNFGVNLRNGHKLEVDHIDNNKLNNRIDNLQLLNSRQNSIKRQIKRKSIFPGLVYREERKGRIVRWEVYIRRKYLGSSCIESVAALLYQKELIRIGEYQ